MTQLGKLLIIVGVLCVVLGVLVSLGSKTSWFSWFGHLPGDIYVKNERFAFYFPLATCLVVSLVISLVFYFFRR